LFIPNIFTPNGDRFNQYFKIDERLIGGTLNVFDRWGNQVFHSSGYQNDWDGNDLASGVYFYIFNGGECTDQKKGTLTILK
jgi:gliding motility-associated-like protein